MEHILDFLDDHAIPEHKTLISQLNHLFELQGYIEHEEKLQEIMYQFGILENGVLVDNILAIYKEGLNNLLLKLFVVVDGGATIYDLKDILTGLTELEKSIESSSILSLYNEELLPVEQLKVWIEFVSGDKQWVFEDYVTEVSQNLIDNVMDLHDMRDPLDPEELDERIPKRLELIKRLRTINSNLLSIVYIKNNGFKQLVVKETLSKLYGPQLRSKQITPFNIKEISLEIIGLSLLIDSHVDLSEICREFIEFIFPNPLTQSDLYTAVSKQISEHNLKC